MEKRNRIWIGIGALVFGIMIVSMVVSISGPTEEEELIDKAKEHVKTYLKWEEVEAVSFHNIEVEDIEKMKEDAENGEYDLKEGLDKTVFGLVKAKNDYDDRGEIQFFVDFNEDGEIIHEFIYDPEEELLDNF